MNTIYKGVHLVILIGHYSKMVLVNAWLDLMMRKIENVNPAIILAKLVQDNKKCNANLVWKILKGNLILSVINANAFQATMMMEQLLTVINVIYHA